MWPHTACGIETTVSVPVSDIGYGSHVTSYRLRYWNASPSTGLGLSYHVTCDLIPLAVLKPELTFTVNVARSAGHMWPHTACGIETAKARPRSSTRSACHMWPHTACGIETSILFSYFSFYSLSHMWPHTACGIETCRSSPFERQHWVTCDLIPLAVLKPIDNTCLILPFVRHMWPHTACGIETKRRKDEETMLLMSHVTSYRLRYWNA